MNVGEQSGQQYKFPGNDNLYTTLQTHYEHAIRMVLITT